MTARLRLPLHRRPCRRWNRVEWEHIDRVLRAAGGNITQAAALLGLHRRSLQRKLAKRPLGR